MERRLFRNFCSIPLKPKICYANRSKPLVLWGPQNKGEKKSCSLC